MNAIRGQCLTYDQMLDRAANEYWLKRPVFDARCGSVQGYYAHLDAGTAACPHCLNARRLVVAITRLRARRAA